VDEHLGIIHAVETHNFRIIGTADCCQGHCQQIDHDLQINSRSSGVCFAKIKLKMVTWHHDTHLAGDAEGWQRQQAV